MAARVRKKGCAKYTIVRPLFVRVRDCVCPLWFSLARDSGGSGGNGVDGIEEIEIGQRMEKELVGGKMRIRARKKSRHYFWRLRRVPTGTASNPHSPLSISLS